MMHVNAKVCSNTKTNTVVLLLQIDALTFADT